MGVRIGFAHFATGHGENRRSVRYASNPFGSVHSTTRVPVRNSLPATMISSPFRATSVPGDTDGKLDGAGLGIGASRCAVDGVNRAGWLATLDTTYTPTPSATSATAAPNTTFHGCAVFIAIPA